MKNNIPVEVQLLVQDELEKVGEYNCAEYLGEWKDYSVFVPGFVDKSNMPCIGFPPYFLVKDNELTSVMYGIDDRYNELMRLFS